MFLGQRGDAGRRLPGPQRPVTAEEVIRHRPEVVAAARANRAFLARSVRHLAARCGIRQFLDIGTGLPAPRTHAQVTALFGGLPLVPPGVVPVAEWRPRSGPAARADLYAGMARRGR